MVIKREREEYDAQEGKKEEKKYSGDTLLDSVH